MIEAVLGGLAIFVAALALYVAYQQLKQTGWKWRQKRAASSRRATESRSR